jgi:hypothetical protein
MTRTWLVWVLVWCWGVMAFGALLVTAAVPGLDGTARALFVLFSGDPATAEVFDHPAVRFGVGIQGALTLGWGITILTLVQTPAVAARQWRMLSIALIAWYLIDSAISLSTGFWLNAVSNTVLLAAFLIPVLASGVLKRA